MIRHFHVIWALLGMHAPTRVVRRARRSWRYYILLKALRYLYPALILALLLVQAITLGVEFASSHDYGLAAPFCFALVIPVQYVLGYRYVPTRHFEIVVSDVECVQLSDDDRYAFFPTANCCVLTIVGLSLLGAVLSVVLFGFGVQAEGFDLLFERYGHHWFLYVGLSTHYLYLWSTLVLNLFQFNYVFAKKLVDFKQVEQAILVLVFPKSRSDVNKIGEQVNGLRCSLNEAVSQLQTMYTSMTMLGGLAIGVALEFRRVDNYTVFHFVLYGLLQIAYLYLVYQISEKRSDLLKRLQSPAILNKQFKEIETATIGVDTLNDPEVPLATIGARRIAPNSHLTYNDVIDRQRNRWTPDESRSVDSSPLLASAAAMPRQRALLLQTSRSDIAIDIEVLSLLHRVNSKMDWSIVTGLLDKQWAQFSFLGYDFSDSSMIGKTAGLISALIVAGKVLSSFTVVGNGP